MKKRLTNESFLKRESPLNQNKESLKHDANHLHAKSKQKTKEFIIQDEDKRNAMNNQIPLINSQYNVKGY